MGILDIFQKYIYVSATLFSCFYPFRCSSARFHCILIPNYLASPTQWEKSETRQMAIAVTVGSAASGAGWGGLSWAKRKFGFLVFLPPMWLFCQRTSMIPNPAWGLTLLENGLWAPAEKGQRHRFPNRCPATMTNGLALRHRVFQPVP